jgi:thymidylate kinase
MAAGTPRPSGRGLSVALLGPDGIGKSTVAHRLHATYRRPVTVLKIGLTRVGGGSMIPTAPHSVRRLLRAARLVRAIVSARVAVRRGDVVVWDRHPIEERVISSLGRRSSRIRRLAERLLPKPDLIIVLDAPGEVVRDRKAERGLKELEQLRSEYLAIGDVLPSVAIVDATRTDGEVQEAVVDAISSFEQSVGEARNAR